MKSEHTDYERWKTVPRTWLGRNRVIANLCEENMRIIEFGAGNADIRSLIPKSCVYTPSDLYPRISGTIICDLNVDELPDMSKYDTVVVSGVLEYLIDVPKFIKSACGPEFIDTFICSYNFTEDPYQRLFGGWKNDYTYAEIKAMMWKQAKMIEVCSVKYQNQIVMKFKKEVALHE